MSDEQGPSTSADSSTRMLAAEYKDGHLKIVEVTPYDKSGKQIEEDTEGEIEVLDEETENDDDDSMKYMKVLQPGKNMVVDLLNLTLVRCQDGQEAYQIVSNSESGDDTTVTCVISNDDGEDHEGQDESYVVIEGEEGPVVFLQSALQQANQEKPSEQPKESSPVVSPTELLERAKALQKAKALMTAQSNSNRKRKHKMPITEMLQSPQFKLFLYSCKLCSFKCNAIKELTAHKAAEHVSGGSKWGGRGGRASTATLQCARCPYRANTHTQLMKHVKEKHIDNSSYTRVYLENAMSLEADVLVCGACGFECAERDAFKRHVDKEHAPT